MSDFTRFMKQNKKKKENATYAATKSLVDEKGNPLVWTLKPITTAENDDIRDDCTYDVQVKGKPNVYRQKVNTSLYQAKMICASVVEPNLYDKDLQDSYGVASPEDLLKELVDDPGEYTDLFIFVQQLNGFSTMDEMVEEAKN